jgi:hypothetical protein
MFPIICTSTIPLLYPHVFTPAGNEEDIVLFQQLKLPRLFDKVFHLHPSRELGVSSATQISFLSALHLSRFALAAMLAISTLTILLIYQPLSCCLICAANRQVEPTKHTMLVPELEGQP